LACVSSQIISPRENKPVISIVQDSLLGANRITRDCVEFSEKILMDLLMWNKDFDGILPKPLNDNPTNPKWSGHQLISMILPEITLNMGNKSFDEENENYDSQNFIKIKNGIMSQGKIDKDILTKSSRGIIQILFNDYGQKESTNFLDNIQYIITNYLVRTGFSCGISDLIATQYTKDKMKKEMDSEIDEVKVKMQHVHLNIFDNQSSKTNTELFEEEVNNQL
jgi:DNA-directed RNA polymerase II subunit RPB1